MYTYAVDISLLSERNGGGLEPCPEDDAEDGSADTTGEGGE